MKKTVKKMATKKRKCFRAKVMVLALNEIKVDPDYQRNRKESSIKRMVNNFDPTLVNLPKVGLRPDGSFFCFDGQHTIEGLRRLGFTHCECMVYETQGGEEEAGIFILSNTERKSVNTCEKHIARLKHGFVEAREVDQALKKIGVGVRGQEGNFDFRIGVITPLYQAQSRGQLGNLIAVMSRLWRTPKAWKSEVMYGLTAFLSKYHDKIEQKNLIRMCDRLRKHSEEVVISDLKARIGQKGSKESLGSEYFLEQYNSGLRKGRL